jgi:VanZ family protein
VHPPRGIEDHRLSGTWGRWLPVAAYIALIFVLSSIPYLTPPLHVNNADKLAHFMEYGGLGFLFARAWKGSRLARRGRFMVFLLTVLVGVTVGGLDELNQGHVPGRTKSLADLATDLSAVVVAAGVMTLRDRRGKPEKDVREGG